MAGINLGDQVIVTMKDQTKYVGELTQHNPDNIVIVEKQGTTILEHEIKKLGIASIYLKK